MSKDLETESIYKLLAAKRIIHTPVEEILSEFKITKAKLYKLLASSEYKLVLKEVSDEATQTALYTWKASMEKLISESHRVLRERLKDNDLEAVKVVLKSIGVDNQTPIQQASSLTVVLPDFKQEKVIEVKND